MYSSNRGKRTFSGAFAGSSRQDALRRRGFRTQGTVGNQETQAGSRSSSLVLGEEAFTPTPLPSDYFDDLDQDISFGSLLDGPEPEVPRALEEGQDMSFEDDTSVPTATQPANSALPGIGAYEADEEDVTPEPVVSSSPLLAAYEDEEFENTGQAGTGPSVVSNSMSLLLSVRAAQEEEEKAIAVARGEEARQWGEGLGRLGMGRRGRSREMIRQRNIGGSAEEMRERWEETLITIPSEFIEGDEAMLRTPMNSKEEMTRGKHLYQGLPVYPSNNWDLNYMYKIAYAAKAVRQSLVDGSFAQLRSTFGQLCRFLVAVKVVKTEKLCEEGGFFQGLQHEVLELFLKFFILNAAPSTVVLKAKHCSLFCQHAMRFYNADGKPREAAKMDEVLQYVRGIHSNAKSEDKIAMGHRTMESRQEQHKFLTGDEMQELRRGALRILHSIAVSFENIEEAESRDAVIDYLKSSKELLSKFSLNFLALLVLSGGGQRPQVYAGLLTPKEDAIKRMRGCISIPIGREKKLRVSPLVVFPQCVRRATLNYIRYVRPAIVELRKVPEDEKSLLLHTRYGTPITTASVRATFKTFAERMGEVYANITPMCIRTSHATDMLKRYREGTLKKDMTEAQFFADLAKSMNTSPDMLRNTYVLMGADDYKRAAMHLSEHMNEE